jgi:hypothetical protein
VPMPEAVQTRCPRNENCRHHIEGRAVQSRAAVTGMTSHHTVADGRLRDALVPGVGEGGASICQTTVITREFNFDLQEIHV